MVWWTILKGLVCVLVLLVLIVGVGLLFGLWKFADIGLGCVETSISRVFNDCYEDWL